MNTLITPSWVTKDVAMNWKNHIRLVARFTRRWDDSWRNKPEGAQIGFTVQARIPQRWVVNEGQALVQQALLNQTVPITLNHQFQIGMGWSSAEDTLLVEEVQERYTKTAGQYMANKCDVVAGAEVYKSVYFSAGFPAMPLSTNGTWTDAVAKLRNVGVPDGLVAVVDPLTESQLLQANFALFNPGAMHSEHYREGEFSGAALGVDSWNYDPNLPTHTSGTLTSATPIVSGGSQTGSSLSVSGLGSGYALKAGDVFTIAGVNAVNPLSFVDTGQLQDFVLVQDVSGSTTGTLSISPAIITSGPLQTVTASPANSAAIAFRAGLGVTTNLTIAASTTSRQSLLFNPEAFAWVTADLKEKLAGANSYRMSDAEAKVSMRWVEQYNIQTDQHPSRVDMIVGTAPVLPYFGMRMWS